jgi:hypothetical protein
MLTSIIKFGTDHELEVQTYSNERHEVETDRTE